MAMSNVSFVTLGGSIALGAVLGAAKQNLTVL